MSVQDEDELNAAAFQVYLYLIRVGQPVGPRDVMRGANLSSPSVAYRYLQKLVDLGLVNKDEYGNYMVKAKLGVKGYVWLGRNLFPRFIVFAFFFAGLLIVEITVLALRLLAEEPIEPSYILLTMVTTASAVVFLFEGLHLKKKMTE